MAPIVAAADHGLVQVVVTADVVEKRRKKTFDVSASQHRMQGIAMMGRR